MRAAFLAFAVLAVVVWIGIAVGANMRTPGVVGLAATIFGGMCASVLTIAIGGAIALKLGSGDHAQHAARASIDTPYPELAPALTELELRQRPVLRMLYERAAWRAPLGAAAGIALWSAVVALGAPGGVFDFATVMLGGAVLGYVWAHIQASRENAAIYVNRAVDTLASGLGSLNWRPTAQVDAARLGTTNLLPGGTEIKTTGEIAGVHAGLPLRITPIETVPPAGADKGTALKALLINIEAPQLSGSIGDLATARPAAPALIEQLSTLPHLGKPKAAIADGRVLIIVPETGAPRVFDAPSKPGMQAAVPALARVSQVIGAVLHVTDALAAPPQA